MTYVPTKEGWLYLALVLVGVGSNVLSFGRFQNAEGFATALL
jgi:hypothetical protein